MTGAFWEVSAGKALSTTLREEPAWFGQGEREPVGYSQELREALEGMSLEKIFVFSDIVVMHSNFKN